MTGPVRRHEDGRRCGQQGELGKDCEWWEVEAMVERGDRRWVGDE